MEPDDVDEGFLSLIEAAEAQALDQKRRKLSHGDGGGGRRSEEEQSQPNSTPEGKYTAALKGIKTAPFQQYPTEPAKFSGNTFVSDNGSSGGGPGDTCYKCGKLGHWARDCVDSGGGGVSGAGGGSYGLGFGGTENSSAVDDKQCPCGLGVCLVLTANTEKNPGRKFYRCPARQENGGCGFFEWCDNSSSTPNTATRYSASNTAQYPTPISSFPDLACPCGAGLCKILIAKTEKNMGQQFYRCPANQENSCGFFKWCNERTSNVGSQANTMKVSTNMNDSVKTGYGDTRGNSCFKCGQDGHWSRDCPGSSSASSVEVGGKSVSSGACYKCGGSGHWARDCVKPSSTPFAEAGGKSVSSAGCYKCGGSGHWARDCPAQDWKGGQRGVPEAIRSYQPYQAAEFKAKREPRW